MTMHKRFRQTAIVVALSSLFPAAVFADEVEELTNPNVADAAFKLPYINQINPFYRQYNGINHEGVNGNLDLDYFRRSPDGTWIRMNAWNLGLSTQEFGASVEQQGKWAFGIDYNQIPRYAPYEVTTRVQGVGSNNIRQPNVTSGTVLNGVQSPTPQQEITLKTQRDITTLSASAYLIEGLKASLSFKNENKTGTQMYGVRGVAGTGTPNLYSGFLFAPQPIDQLHQQLEAVLDYADKKLQISGGYYGSFLNANPDSLNVYGGTNTATVTANLSPVAMPPDNAMQQLYVSGAYNFSDTTRGNFKLARSEGRQTNSFFTGQPTQPGIGANLEGKVTTTEAYAAITSRVTSDLRLLGSWRFEDKHDRTPVRVFYTDGSTNNPESHQANWGKLEADYNIGAGYSAALGVDYLRKFSYEWERLSVEELTYRATFSKAMSEMVNGLLTLSHTDRTGAEWTPTKPNIFPNYLANLSRNKARAMLDTSFSDALNMQLAYEAYFDNYTRSDFGLSSGQGQIISLDGSYGINDNWKLNAWYSHQWGDSLQNARGAVCTTANGVNCQGNLGATSRTPPELNEIWTAKLAQKSDQFGIGVNGKIAEIVTVGAQYLYANDRLDQDSGPVPATTINGNGTRVPVAASNGVLPETRYTQNTFKVYGVYPVSKATRIRLDYIFDQRKMDDYTWTNWVYADGTKVYVDPNQITQIFGVSLIQSF